MLISYKNQKLEKVLTNSKKLIKKYGPDQAKLIARRINEIKASDNLSILGALPQARLHELKQNRQGQLSVDVKQPYRLIFVPDYDDPPVKQDGGLDWDKIERIKILEIEDTHGK